METQHVFHKLLDPKFNWKELADWETLVGLAQEAVSIKDVPQRILGKIVNQLDTERYGVRKRFASEIGVSPNNLKIYAWVERKLEGLDIPLDIPYSSLRVIASTDDPKKWVDRINKEGLSFAEVKREVMLEKGIEPSHGHKKIKCPKCKSVTEDIKCQTCGEMM